jgi:hypothetical protein
VININDLTLGQIKEIQTLNSGQPSEANPFEVGKAYLIRTVTMTWCGRVVKSTGQFLSLDDAAWIADTGRYSEAISKGSSVLNEVEPAEGIVIVGLGSVVDAVEWSHSLPLCVK